MEDSGKRNAPAALCPWDRTPVPVQEVAGWASGPVCTFCRREKNLPPACIRNAARPAHFLVATSTTLSVVLPLGAVFAIIARFVQ